LNKAFTSVDSGVPPTELHVPLAKNHQTRQLAGGTPETNLNSVCRARTTALIVTRTIWTNSSIFKHHQVCRCVEQQQPLILLCILISDLAIYPLYLCEPVIFNYLPSLLSIRQIACANYSSLPHLQHPDPKFSTTGQRTQTNM
jgi:hypothetical protein